MPKRIFALLPFVLIISTACQLFSQIPGTVNNPAGNQSSGGGLPNRGSGIFGEPANPLNVSLTLDSSAVTQVIPLNGGTLSATGSDGTRYTLIIPSGALQADTEISLNPIRAISDLPFSGRLGGAALLEPSGLAFDQFVTLRIEPASPIALADQVLFGFEANGEDLHLALPGSTRPGSARPGPDSSAIEIQLLHFSGAGVASGTSDEKAAVYKRMADRVETRLTNEMGDYFQKLRQGQTPDSGELEALFQEFYNSVVIPRLKAATAPSATCADGQIAIQTYFGWERQRQLLGASDEGAKMEMVLTNFFPTIARRCMDEEFERCTVEHEIAGMLPTLLGFERQGQLLGAFNADDSSKDDPKWAEVRQYGQELMRKCFQFELVFESAGTFNINPDGYDSSVSARVPIRPQGDLSSLFIELKGSSALINEHFQFNAKVENCDQTSNRGGGTFEATNLGWETVVRKDAQGNPRFYVKDFILAYFPGSTSESIHMACWDPGPPLVRYPPMDTPPAPFWTALFIMTHFKEVENPTSNPPAVTSIDQLMEGAGPALESGQAYIARLWQVNASETLGTKKWSGTSELDANIFEGGEFQLMHKPQR